MRCAYAVALVVLGSTSLTFAQNDLPTFRAEGASAFVWGDDNYSSAVSSSIHDPVTGNVIHKLSHAGIEVSSEAGFESIGYGAAGELLSFTTTIANNTESELSVRRGGASIEGHVAFPLLVGTTNRGKATCPSILAPPRRTESSDSVLLAIVVVKLRSSPAAP